jgi:hypothetical protein
MSDIKLGDKVSWTKIGGSGRTVSMSLREGVVVEIVGIFARVKTSSNRIAMVEVDRLRLQGQKSQITEFVESMRNGETKDLETPWTSNVCPHCGKVCEGVSMSYGHSKDCRWIKAFYAGELK